MFADALMAEMQKNTGMWFKLFNSVLERYYEAGTPLPNDQVDIL
ncbi:hypothetical protein [Psychrobacter sp. JCM 18900]|nr:hypothetical protein [Psychrobacter sp. JCM 18900]